MTAAQRAAAHRRSRRARACAIARGAVAAALGFWLACATTAHAGPWRFSSFDERDASPAAEVGAFPDFRLSLRCFTRSPTAAAPLYGADAPAPLLIFIPTQGFVRDLLADFDASPSIDVTFQIDGRDAGRIAFEYSADHRAFVGAAGFDGALVEALQAGRRVVARGSGFDAFGAASLEGSRRAIDRLRAACAGAAPSRPTSGFGGADPLGAAVIEIPVATDPDVHLRLFAPLW